MTTDAPKIPQIGINSNVGKWKREGGIRLPSLALHFSERKLLLVVFDLLMVNVAFFMTLMIRSQSEVTPSVFLERLPWFALLTALWITIGVVLNIYDLARAACVAPSLWVTIGAATLTGLIYLFIPYLTPALPKHRFQAMLFPLFAMAGVGMWRIFYARVFAQPIFHQRALIVGAGPAGRALAGAIAATGASDGDRGRSPGYQLLGFVDDDLEDGSFVAGLPVLGACQDLVRLAQDLRADEVIVAINGQENIDRGLYQAILDCREIGIPITTMESLYERLVEQIPIESTYLHFSALLPLRQSATNRLYLMLKRLIEILVSLIGCGLMLALVPFVWLAHRVSSPGPLFFRQERVGRSGKRFTLIKFRSMVVNAEKETGPIWAAVSDKRITSIGRFLRKTRLDEIPQFWNVLKGEMSLIGPRPERPEFVSQLAPQIPFYRARHGIKPGLTGWAQIRYGYGSSTEDARIKLQYDLYYIKHRGPYLDLLILLRTIQVILGLNGR